MSGKDGRWTREMRNERDGRGGRHDRDGSGGSRDMSGMDEKGDET